MTQNVILVDEFDNITGHCEKLLVHQYGKLHRAFSVFVVNSKGELLIQQRALDKYHSGGLWSNTCCSHFTSGEKLESQVEQRLEEEMGIKTKLKWIFNYRYRVTFENGLQENEIAYSYLGLSDENPLPNQEEVKDWKWINIDFLKDDLNNSPTKYSFWFKYSFDSFSRNNQF
jgi:isopentenyl-diphosphate delta-isomerase